MMNNCLTVLFLTIATLLLACMFAVIAIPLAIDLQSSLAQYESISFNIKLNKIADQPAPLWILHAVAPTPISTATAFQPAQLCHPSYSGVCLEIVGDLDCGQIQAVNFSVVGIDEYHLDADRDNIACE